MGDDAFIGMTGFGASATVNVLYKHFGITAERVTQAAQQMLGRTRHWISLAMHLLALSQGVATVANAFQDKAYLDSEVCHIEQWLNTVTSSHTEHC